MVEVDVANKFRDLGLELPNNDDVKPSSLPMTARRTAQGDPQQQFSYA